MVGSLLSLAPKTATLLKIDPQGEENRAAGRALVVQQRLGQATTAAIYRCPWWTASAHMG